MGGFRHINGFPGGPPVRPNLSLGDTLAALNAIIGILLALVARGRSASGRGQVVDVAIYEAVFNVLESMVCEYDGAGVIRGPSGSTLTGIVPTNTYPCSDGKYVVIGGNADSIFRRLMRAARRPDLAGDARLADNAGRVRHREEVDDAISQWTSTLASHRVLAELEAASVPAGAIYSVEDMLSDPHFKARGLFEEVDIGGHTLKLPAIMPFLSETPGATDWPGPALGAHNAEIYKDLLGLAQDELDALEAKQII
jgi:crotonobetainyl-CoA:carnitine CoA-transferase CaiB-like acyl-CoA transferase